MEIYTSAISTANYRHGFSKFYIVPIPHDLINYLWDVTFPPKECIHFENTPRHIPHDLELWPMTLTYKLDLDILPLDLHAKIQVRLSVRSAVRVRRTDGHTDNVKTTTPDTSQTWGILD